MNRSEEIDVQALRCCRQMVGKEKMEWLKEWQEFKHSVLGYKGKVDVGIRYYKGKRKGKIRDVWEVDGVEFMKLWKLVEGYVYTSAQRSNYRSNQEGVEDDVSEIKLLMFRVLRFFGPCPSNSSFSNYLKLIVNNILTNGSIRRGATPDHKFLEMFIAREIEEACKDGGGKPDFKLIAHSALIEGFGVGMYAKPSEKQREKIFRNIVRCVARGWRKHRLLLRQGSSKSLTEQRTISVQALKHFKQPSSIFDVVKVGSEDGEAVCRIDTMASTDEDTSFWVGVPENLKRVVERICYEGESICKIAPDFGMTTKQFKGYLQSNLL